MVSRWLKRGLGSLATLGLVLGLAFVAGRGGASSNRHMTPEPVQVTSYQLPFFKHGEPATTRFGPLEYIGGLEMRGSHPNFGGISAIRIAADGHRFLGVTDTGDWIEGSIAYLNGRPVSVQGVTIAPVMGPGGQRAKDMGLWDSESLVMDGDQAFVGIERDHTILAFDRAKGGLRAEGRKITLPDYVADWPENRGIEALGILPVGTSYAGRLLGLSERSGGRDDPTEGFVIRKDGSDAFRFRLKRSEGFDITDLDFLPNGDLIVLERYFSPLRGVAMRLRRVTTEEIKPDALVDGEVLLTADKAFHVDNMEGLSIHRDAAGATVFTLVSDDNFSVAQRTLLLQFRWIGP
jgi:hypothetical protein